MGAKILLLGIFAVCYVFLCEGNTDRLCYSCTYTFNPGSSSNECVDEPWNFTATANVVVCNETDPQGNELFCVTNTQQIKDYEADKMYIWTMSRGCLIRTLTSCEEDANYYTCASYCTDNLCNDQDESYKDDQEIPGTGNPPDAADTVRYGSTILLAFVVNFII